MSNISEFSQVLVVSHKSDQPVFPSKGPMPERVSCRIKKKQQGFSLIELLVVLVLLGIMAGVTGPAVGRFMTGLDFKKQTAEVMAIMRYARLMAVTEGKALTVTATEGSNSLTMSGAVQENRALGLAESDTLELDPEEIIFFPEGYATPATLTFTKEERSQKIIIDPMTGLPIIDFSDDD